MTAFHCSFNRLQCDPTTGAYWFEIYTNFDDFLPLLERDLRVTKLYRHDADALGGRIAVVVLDPFYSPDALNAGEAWLDFRRIAETEQRRLNWWSLLLRDLDTSAIEAGS